MLYQSKQIVPEKLIGTKIYNSHNITETICVHN